MLSGHAVGTNDALSWEHFAHLVHALGLLDAYRADPLLNHPPLILYLASGTLWCAQQMDLPFVTVFRLIPIIADAGCCVLLYRIALHRRVPLAWHAPLLYAYCPLAILVSAYHTNTDTVCAFFCLLATYFLQEHRRFGAAGSALACAIHVKLIPVLLVLPLCALARSRQEAVRFLGALAIGSLPFFYPLLGAPEAFIPNALQYNSMFAPWGMNMLGLLLHPFTPWAEQLLYFYRDYGRFAVLGASGLLAIAVRTRGWTNAYAVGASMLLWFLVLAPGFGVQYTVLLLPLLCAANQRYGMLYGAMAGVFAGLVYWEWWTGTWPAFSLFSSAYFPMPAPWVGLVVWGYLIAVHSRLRRTQLP